MDVANASRRRTYDLPKSESGLAEWTSKIKALQRQVDEDEENETKKLEEEIRTSRMTRIRRSTTTNSADLSKNPDVVRVASPTPATPDVAETAEERKRNQEATMRRLMGQRSPGPGAAEFPPGPSPLAPSTPLPKAAPESMSLAAFMGSKATGPRMNKHTPQQDAHDPTQFEQRTKISAPHPVFGRGGVAMPGMSPAVSQRSISQSPNVRVKEELPSPAPLRERKMSTPSVARKYLDKVEQDPPKTDLAYRDNIRERTMSTPTGPGGFRGLSPKPPPKSDFHRSPVSHNSLHASTGDYLQHKSQTNESKSDVSRSPAIQSYLPEVRSTTSDTPIHKSPITTTTFPSPRATMSPSPTPNTPRKTTTPTPALAGLVPPNRKPPILGPHIPSINPSPAFLKPPPSKDVTPSISRLQGRGFVQNMIKVSSRFEADANASSVPITPEKGPATPEPKKPLSVLDRWPGASNTQESPVIQPKPTPMRKTRTLEPTTASPPATPSKPVPSSIPKRKSQTFPPSPSVAVSVSPPKPAVSSPSIPPKPVAPSTPAAAPIEVPVAPTPGVGSSNTLVSYIKPMKTGDSPAPAPAPEIAPTPASRPKTPVKTVTFADPNSPPSSKRPKTPDVDELGVVKKKNSYGNLRKSRDEGRPKSSASPRPHPRTEVAVSSPSQPLSHPTKDRARKPKRGKSTTTTAVSGSSPSTVPVSSVQAPATSEQEIRKPSPEPKKPSPTPTVSQHSQMRSQEPARSASPTGVAFPRSPLQSNSSSSRMADKWGNQPVIGVKPMLNGKGNAPSSTPQYKPEQNGMAGRMALPGLAKVSPPSTEGQKEERSSRPPTPVHVRTRIPSTGNRATVMDVAQALSDHQKGASADAGEEEPEPPRPDVKAAIANWGAPASRSPTLPSSEKRKSSLEKYSVLAMPALKEVPTPAPTIRKAVSPVASEGDGAGVAKKPDVRHSPIDVLRTSMSPHRTTVTVKGDDMVHFDNPPEPFPEVDVDALLRANPVLGSYLPDANTQTVSVDVMSIVGASATAVVKDTNVFYDHEILAVIHRFKVKTAGLMETRVWGWLGKNSSAGERELKALADLAKRYGTKLISVKQYCEPVDLVGVLGGTLAIRQGSRAHWSSENTAMHLVREQNGSIFIDEQDLSVHNLCSGFSYCLSILQMFYVWHGCGSSPSERSAALVYAQGLAADSDSVVELKEGENDDDEMFWMILGEKDYAQAQHWKWRPTSETKQPRVWKVENGISPVPFLAEEAEVERRVFVVDCVWELFVLVGDEARSRRQDIRHALTLAMGLSKQAASSQPFSPPVHVLILPTRLPMDLRLSLRDLDEERINRGVIPEHMNILPAAQAYEHLERSSWDKGALQDKTMLPLGLHESSIP